MTLYKLYWKIVKKNRTGIVVYFIVFIIMSVLTTMSMSDNSDLNFETVDTYVCIRNEDTDSELIKGLIRYLDSKVTIVDAPETDSELKDSLFFRAIEYSITIPKGFSDRLITEQPMLIKRTSIDSSYGSVYVDALIDSYINTYRSCYENQTGLSAKELVEQVLINLDVETKVTLNAKNTGDQYNKLNILFNMATYSAIACLIMAVSAVNFSFYEKEVFNRNMIAPITPKVFTYKLMLANCSLTVFVWFLHIFLGLILCGSQLLTERGFYLSLNLLCLTIVALSISTLTVRFLKSRASVHFAANTISLGLSFLCGAFVPQAMLGDNVVKAAQFTPGYWYIHANDFICSLTEFSNKDVKTIFFHYFISLLFAVAFFSITLLFSKQRGKEES